jgi:hypothetical protein
MLNLRVLVGSPWGLRWVIVEIGIKHVRMIRVGGFLGYPMLIALNSNFATTGGARGGVVLAGLFRAGLRRV